MSGFEIIEEWLHDIAPRSTQPKRLARDRNTIREHAAAMDLAALLGKIDEERLEKEPPHKDAPAEYFFQMPAAADLVCRHLA